MSCKPAGARSPAGIFFGQPRSRGRGGAGVSPPQDGAHPRTAVVSFRGRVQGLRLCPSSTVSHGSAPTARAQRRSHGHRRGRGIRRRRVLPSWQHETRVIEQKVAMIEASTISVSSPEPNLGPRRSRDARGGAARSAVRQRRPAGCPRGVFPVYSDERSTRQAASCAERPPGATRGPTRSELGTANRTK